MATTKLVYGSARFSSAVTNNQNLVLVGGYDVPTKLVKDGDVCLCLPEDLTKWGMYPTHQESWLSLAFIVACHARHEDAAGLAIRRLAWNAIQPEQWAALAGRAYQFAGDFGLRLTDERLSARKAYKCATRALQDCLLYLGEEFPEDQNLVLRRSSLHGIIADANLGRSGELTEEDGRLVGREVADLAYTAVTRHGGDVACHKALASLRQKYAARPGRVILLPEEVSLEQGAALVAYDAVIGIPDAHDMDVISIVEGLAEPRLVQFRDELSGQRLDIIAVPPTLGQDDQLTGGHPSFQSVAEMLLANGTPVSDAGRVLVERLAAEVEPLALARKYFGVAYEFLFDSTNPKSWAARRSDPAVPQIKKAIPLYRVACDLLPRAVFIRRNAGFPGGIPAEALARQAGLLPEYAAVRGFLDAQDAPQEELERVATALMAYLKTSTFRF